MKIDTLIAKLQKLSKQYGNCHVSDVKLEKFEYGKMVEGTNHRDKVGIRIRT